MTAPTVSLAASGSITQLGATTIAATNLMAVTELDAGGAITLGSATNNVTGNVTLAALNGAGAMLAPGAISFADTAGFRIASLGGVQTGIGTTGAVSLTSGGQIAEATGAVVTAASLTGSSVRGVSLSGSNLIGTFGGWSDAGNSSLGIAVIDNEALTVSGAISSATGAVVLIANTGNMTVASGATVSGSLVVLSTPGNFVNDAGAGAVTSSPGNRWLIYSAAPGGDFFGGLDSGNTAIWGASFASLPPEDVTQSGNRYLFALNKTLTVTTTNVAKTYGQDATATVAGAFAITGLETGVPGAYLGDTGRPRRSAARRA